MTFDIYSSESINPDENLNPRPVVVRMFQLTADERMENATHEVLLNEGYDGLGDQLVQLDELTIDPNEHVEVTFARHPQARVLALVAVFRTPTGSSWKTLVELPAAADCGSAGTFFLDANKVDNGSTFDESMFPNVPPVRDVDVR